MSFRQVHLKGMGRVRTKTICERDDEELPQDEMAVVRGEGLLDEVAEPTQALEFSLLQQLRPHAKGTKASRSSVRRSLRSARRVNWRSGDGLTVIGTELLMLSVRGRPSHVRIRGRGGAAGHCAWSSANVVAEAPIMIMLRALRDRESRPHEGDPLPSRY